MVFMFILGGRKEMTTILGLGIVQKFDTVPERYFSIPIL